MQPRVTSTKLLGMQLLFVYLTLLLFIYFKVKAIRHVVSSDELIFSLVLGLSSAVVI